MTGTGDRIPLGLAFPGKLGIGRQSRFFIYFPNPETRLDAGKMFGNGLWSISRDEMKGASIIPAAGLGNPQFLLIYKNPAEDEIVANFYHRGDRFESGPFISAAHRMDERGNIILFLRNFGPAKNAIFEIDGLPEGSTMSAGEAVSDTAWRVAEPEAAAARAFPPLVDRPKKMALSITAAGARSPELKSTFTLIINLSEPPKSYDKKYREAALDGRKILKDAGLEPSRFLMSIRSAEPRLCVARATKAGNKWMAEAPDGGVMLRNFNPDKDTIEITADFMAVGADGSVEILSRKIVCNFKGAIETGHDFSRCIKCRNKLKCAPFGNFMDYIGNSTILRHLLYS